jgi:hypothetical protein
LVEAEQRAAGAAHVAKLKRRKMRRPQPQTPATGEASDRVSFATNATGTSHGL